MKRADAFLPLAVLAVTACTDDHRLDRTLDPYQPGNHVISSTTQLVAYGSCAALEADLETLAIERSGKTSSLLEDGEYEPPQDGGKPTVDLFARPRAATPAPDPGPLEAFTGSEAYVVQLGYLVALSAADASSLSATPIEGDALHLFVDAGVDRALVISQLRVEDLPAAHPLTGLFGVQREEDYHFQPDVVTKLAVLDISDPTRPTTLRETFIEGETVASARRGSVVQLVHFELHESPDELVIADYFDEADPEASRERVLADIRNMTLGDFLPRVVDRRADGSYAARALDEAACQAVSRAHDSHGDGQISLLSLDLSDPGLTLAHREIVANAPRVAHADDRLAVLTASHAHWWYYWFQDDPIQLDVFLFSAGTDGVAHLATTRLESDGWPAIGVLGDVVRVADKGALLLYGRTGDDLGQISREDGIGEYGSVQSLGGDRAFVSDEEVLHVIDLSDQNAPSKTSLTLPGKVVRVERLDQRLLVFHEPSSLVLVELDREPGVVTQLDLGALDLNGLWLGAGVDIADDESLLAVTGRAHVGDLDEDGEVHPVFAEISQLVGLAGDALSLLGSVDHTAFSEGLSLPSDVRRSFFADDQVLVIGTRAASLHALPDLAEIAAQPIEVPDENRPIWW